jgi:hypothetical protein
MHRITLALLPTALFLAVGACSAAEKNEGIQRMQCGGVGYQIESRCRPGENSDSLNICQPQQLNISRGENLQRFTLPQFDQSTVYGITQARRSAREFFVIQWTCEDVEGQSVAILYYSIGGGTGPYVDAAVAYDQRGNLINDRESRIVRLAMARLHKMRPVKSIMPD